MTREQAKNEVVISKSEIYPYNIIDNVDLILDKVYDDFEKEKKQRSCGNCISKIICPILREFSDNQKVLCFQRGWSCSEWEIIE